MLMMIEFKMGKIRKMETNEYHKSYFASLLPTPPIIKVGLAQRTNSERKRQNGVALAITVVIIEPKSRNDAKSLEHPLLNETLVRRFAKTFADGARLAQDQFPTCGILYHVFTFYANEKLKTFIST
jgi:hypothetical protein